MEEREPAEPRNISGGRPSWFKRWAEGFKDTWVLSAWMGLVFGSLEGILSFILITPHVPECVYVSVLVDLLLFILLGIVLQSLSLLFQERTHYWISFIILCLVGVRFGAGIAFPFRPRVPLYLGMIGSTGLLVLLAFWTSQRKVKQFQRASWPWILGLILLWTIGTPVFGRFLEWRATRNLPPVASDAPNVILIIADTLAANHLSLYGYDRPTDPNLVNFAKEGVIFENAIAPSSWTLPSHASMLTGRMPHEHHVDIPGKALDNRFPILGEAFSARGYRTAAFSANPGFFMRKDGFGRGFLHFEDFANRFWSVIQKTYYGSRIVKWVRNLQSKKNVLSRESAEELNQHVLHWIDRDAKPFVIVMNYYDVHDPYFPSPPYTHKYLKSKEPQGLTGQTFNMFPTLTPPQVQDEMDAYDGSINYLDAQVRQLLKALHQRGLDQNTLVVFTADHGETFNVHGFMTHANALYFDLIHVPLIFRWPGRIPAGVRISRPITTAALPSTLLDLVDKKPSNLFPWRSLADLWRENPSDSNWPDPISELAQMRVFKGFPNFDGPLRCVLAPQWHYIESARSGKELFAWNQDPMELHNLANTPEGQATCKQLGGQVQRVAGDSYSPKLPR